MDRQGPYWQMRPVGGGKEWDVPPDEIDGVPASSPEGCKHLVLVTVNGKKYCASCSQQIYL